MSVMYKIKTSDDVVFELSANAFKLSNTFVSLQSNVSSLSDATSSTEPVQVARVDAATMRHVVRFLEHHSHDEEEPDKEKQDETPLRGWDKEFMTSLALQQVYDVFTAANFLDVKGLLTVCAKHVATFLNGKTPAEMRNMQIPDDV